MKRVIAFSLLLLAGTAAQAAFVGDPAPAFSLPSLDGGPVALADFKGKDVVLVNFWASWCPPCNEEFPELNELANEYKEQNVRVLAVNLDKSPERVQTFLARLKVKPGAIQILMDPKAKVVAEYVARAMPTSFIVDKTGTIRFVHFGFNPKDPAKWRQELDQLLAAPKP